MNILFLFDYINVKVFSEHSIQKLIKPLLKYLIIESLFKCDNSSLIIKVTFITIAGKLLQKVGVV